MGGDVDDDEAETMQVMQGWGVAAGDESLTQHFHGDGEGTTWLACRARVRRRRGTRQVGVWGEVCGTLTPQQRGGGVCGGQLSAHASRTSSRERAP